MKFKVIHSTPVLVSTTKGGESKFWKGLILTDKGRYFRQAETWRNLKDGSESKHLFSEPYEIFGKNEGKKNETSAKEQAFKDMESIVKKQYDKGYTKPGEKSNILPLPMLAHKFKDRKGKVSWPAFVQPKLDGQRMLFDGEKAWSRGGKLQLPKVYAHLMFDTQGHIVDGEIILPGNQLLQESSKAIKKFYEGISDKLLYCVYDVVEPDMTFKERHELLKTLVKNAPKNVVLVPTHLVENESEVMTFHSSFKKQGYEGTMIRNGNGKYLIKNRSDDLLKLKDFQDGEFRIVDVLEGGGKFKGTAIFKCITSNGETFDCTPEGTMESRAEMWKNRKKLIGKWLTIRYQFLSKDGVPIFLTGVDIRDTGEF